MDMVMAKREYLIVLDSIANLFEGQVDPHFAEQMTDWGERVLLYRQYVRGEHDVYLTNTMRRMLNLKGRKFETFSADYTDMVVRMMSERLVVERIEAIVDNPNSPIVSPSNGDGDIEDDGDDRAQEWVDDLLKKNRFDALQMDVHEATARDGDVFVIVDFDEAMNCARLNLNLAWDGDVGVIPIYSRSNPREMMAAVKVMYVDAEIKRATVYYADRVEVYETDGSGSAFQPAGDSVPWMPGVLPVIHFSNRRRSGRSTGISELAKMIALQDILNRTLVSMVMTSEFSAFPVLFAKGFKPPAQVAPGDVIYYNESDPTKLQYAEFTKIDGSSLSGYIEQINKLIDLISEVTQTPIASVLGTNPSGEALKQRESGLLTKIRGAHVKLGNAWEDVLKVAHGVEMAYKAKNKPPMILMFDTQWKDASIRSDLDVITQAGMVFDRVQSMPLYLEMVSDVTGWDETKRQEILQAQAEQTAATMGNFSNLLGSNPNNEFGLMMNGVGVN